jgi:SnoaL-like domain
LLFRGGDCAKTSVMIARMTRTHLSNKRGKRFHALHRLPTARSVITEEIDMAKEKTTRPDDAVAIARAAYEAYVTKDRTAIERLIADDFHFTSPLDNRINRETYFARCWPNSAWIQDFAYINLVPDGDRVFVTYEGQSTKGNRFRNTEIFTLRNGQIVEVEVYFGWSVPHKAEPGGFLPDDDLN